VTVAAIYSIITDVMFVAKLHGLLAFHPLARIPRRAIDLGRNPKRGQKNEDGSKNTHLRQSIGAVMEDLWHRRSFANDCSKFQERV